MENKYMNPQEEDVTNIVSDPDTEMELSKYYDLKEQLRDLKTQKENLKQNIILKLDKYDEITNHFGDVVTRLSTRKGSKTVEWKDLLNEIIYTANDSQKKIIEALQKENTSITTPHDAMSVRKKLYESMDSNHVIRTMFGDSELDSIIDEEIEAIRDLINVLSQMSLSEDDVDSEYEIDEHLYNDEPLSLAASKYMDSSLQEDWIKSSPKPKKNSPQLKDDEIEAAVKDYLELDNQLKLIEEKIKDQKTVCSAKLSEYVDAVSMFGDYIVEYRNYPEGVTRVSHSKVVKSYIETVSDSEKRVINTLQSKLTKEGSPVDVLATNLYIEESVDFSDNITAGEIQQEIDLVTEINNNIGLLIDDLNDSQNYIPLAASLYESEEIEEFYNEDDVVNMEPLLETPSDDTYFILEDDIYYAYSNIYNLEVNLWYLVGKSETGQLKIENVDKPGVVIKVDINDIEVYDK